jgi:hypothetical protein
MRHVCISLAVWMMEMTHDAGISVAKNRLRSLHYRWVFSALLAALAPLGTGATSDAGQFGIADCATGVSCDECCGFGSFWVRGEVLLWWTNRGGNPALVTTSPSTTPPELAGRLNQGPTSVLFAGEDLTQGLLPGGRITFGWWFDDVGTAGLEANYFRLGDGNAGFQATSAQNPILARPFFDMPSNSQDALLIAHPSFLQGSINIDLDSSLQGFGVTWRQRLLQGCGHRTDLLIGYRLLEFDERLRIASDSQFTAPSGQIVAGTTRNVLDQLDVSSFFHGAELGLAHSHQFGCLTADVSFKVALGGTTSEVDIDGRTVTTVPGAGSAQFSGGLFAQETNIGWYQDGRFAAVPELAVRLGYDLTPNLRVMCGYNLIVWPYVMRAIDQVDVRMSQLPPEPQAGLGYPKFPGATSTFVAQGLQLGLQLVW